MATASPPADSAPSPGGAKISRTERVKANRAALMRVAAEIIGERGYEETSVARITERAGLAHGTFYRYFESRQDLFDRLLPEVGDELIEQLKMRVSGAPDIFGLEELGFRGFFEFLVEHPGFYRLLNEAEVASPKAFEQHIDNLARHYVSALERSRNRGELPGFEPRELEVLAFILMAARFYVYLRFSKTEGGPGPLPDWIVAAYMKFLRFGLAGQAVDSGHDPERETKPRRRKRT